MQAQSSELVLQGCHQPLPHLLTSGLKASSGGRASLLSAQISWWPNKSLSAAAAMKKLVMAPSAHTSTKRHMSEYILGIQEDTGEERKYLLARQEAELPAAYVVEG